jgi:hypothetical protein
MPSNADEVFLIINDNIRPLQARPFKVGLFGKSLEDALQTLVEKYPNLINGRQIDPGSSAALSLSSKRSSCRIPMRDGQ